MQTRSFKGTKISIILITIHLHRLTSSIKLSSIKVDNVDTMPRNMLRQDITTNAVLGTRNINDDGYIIGITDQL